MAGENSNGTPITRRELASELRAARSDDRLETVRAIQTAVAPVVEHIHKLNEGEFSPGFKAGIIAVVDEERKTNWLLRSNKAASISVVSVLTFGVINMVLNLKLIG